MNDYAGQYDESYEEEAEPVEPKPFETLVSYIDNPNIADLLDDETLSKIGAEVVCGYEIDKGSRSEWEKQTEAAMKLAMQVAEEKSWPWPKAANVKYPLITTAAIQFSARSYPAIVQGAQVVKGKVNGPDPDGQKKLRADRVGNHMSFQLLEEMEEWDEETDRLLLDVSIVGCSFRKTYFDSALSRNVSELCRAREVVYDHATTFRKLRRITHEIPLYKNDVLERVRGGRFREIELGTPVAQEAGEYDAPYEFLEQHCWYDLDGDDYKEPYIVTVKKDTKEVVRIVARFDKEGIFVNEQGEIGKIEPVEYFTKYSFLPNPDGGSYDIGLGILLNPINETVNSVLNQMLDAGTLANTGGGFIGSGLKMGRNKGAARFVPGEFKSIDSPGGAIRDNIYHMQFPGPSAVLFELLGLLIEAGKDIASVKDVLTGESQGKNASPTTTLALIEQGLKTFTAIFKRIHRSLKQEFKKLYRLNKLYLEPESYFMFQDQATPIMLEDYQGDETDVSPVSDPNMVSDAQELAKAEALMRFVGDPYVNQMEIRKRYMMALKEETPEALLQEPPPAPQDPKVTEMIAKIEILEQETKAKIDKMESETAKIRAETIKALAEAEAQELGNQMAIYMGQFEALLNSKFEAMNASTEAGAGGVSSVEEEPGNQEVPGIPSAVPPISDGQMGGGGIQLPDPGSEPLEESGGGL